MFLRRALAAALAGLLAAAWPQTAVCAMQPKPPANPDAFEIRGPALLDCLRAWFMDPSENLKAPELVFSTVEKSAHAPRISELLSLHAQASFLKAGRYEGWDDHASYADMAVLVASRLGVKPPEAAIHIYRARLRSSSKTLSKAEEEVRAELAEAIRAPEFIKRHLYIADLVGLPGPDMRDRRRKRPAKRPPELAPPPQFVSVIDLVDWEKADELAEVADDNARNWDRKTGESSHRYRRRLRHLRKRCYEWVRRDLTALGFWNAGLFHGFVPPTRRDPKRPIRAASFALAMAKVEEADAKNDPLASKTTLRQLNLHIDPLVRGAIVVFSQNVCGYDSRSGHIEIVTSVEPLRAASYKFHSVTMECLVHACDENRVHVYVPLRLDPRRLTVSSAPAART